MARPLSNSAKHRREYVVVLFNPATFERRFITREGYKRLILDEFSKCYPDWHISIYVHSGSVCPTLK